MRFCGCVAVIKAQPVNLFSQRFSFTTLYCVEIILSLTTQGVPDTTTFTEGDGRARVCVCVGVWVHVCLYLGKCLLTRMNMLLHLMCIVLWRPTSVCPLFFYYLFVCLFVSSTFTIVILLPGRPRQGERSAFVSCHADNIAHIEWEYTFGRELVNVNANTNQQTKTKEAQYGSLSWPEPLHLLCLPSPLVGVAIRSYNDRISFLTQGPS